MVASLLVLGALAAGAVCRVAAISALPALIGFHLVVASASVLAVSLLLGVGSAYRSPAAAWAPATAWVLLVAAGVRYTAIGVTSPPPPTLLAVVATAGILLGQDLLRSWPWSARPMGEPVVAWWTAVSIVMVVFAAVGPTSSGAAQVAWIELRLTGAGLIVGGLAAFAAGFGRRGRRAWIRWTLVVAAGGTAVLSGANRDVDVGLALAAALSASLGLLTYWHELVDQAVSAGRVAGRGVASEGWRRRGREGLRAGTDRSAGLARRNWVILVSWCAPQEPVVEQRLGRSGRLAVGAMAVLALGWVAAGLRWAERVGWQPTGHAATLMARAHDVGTRDHPLTGMMTSLGSLGEVKHPGPFVFDLAAPFVRTLGVRQGSYAVAATIALVCWAVATWGAWRAGGRSAGVLAWAAGALVLAIPVQGAMWEMNNVYPTMLAMFAVVTTGWAAASGVGRAWWWCVVMGSFCAQAYLPHGLIVVGIVVWSGLALAGLWRRVPDPALARSLRRDLLIGWVVGVVCWLQPLIDMVWHQGGNVRAIALNVAAPRPPLGPAGFPRAVAWMFSIPPRWGVLTSTMAGAGDADEFVGGSLIVGGLVAAAVAIWWATTWTTVDPVRRQLRVVVVFVVVAAGINGTQLPQEYLRTFDVGWIVVCSLIVWFAVVVDVVAAAEATVVRDHAALVRPLRVGGFAACALVVLAAALAGPGRIEDVKERQFTIDAMVDPVVDQTMANAGSLRGRPVLALGMDSRLNEVAADTITSNLIVRGLDLRFEPAPGIQYGRRRTIDGSWAGPMLWVVSGLPPVDPEGRRLARATVPGWSDEHAERVADEVARWARAHGPLTLEPFAAPLLARYLAGWVEGDPCRAAGDVLAGRVAVEDLPPGVLLTLVADLAISTPMPASLTEAAGDVVGQAPIEVWEVDSPQPGPARADVMVRDGSRCGEPVIPP